MVPQFQYNYMHTDLVNWWVEFVWDIKEKKLPQEKRKKGDVKFTNYKGIEMIWLLAIPQNIQAWKLIKTPLWKKNEKFSAFFKNMTTIFFLKFPNIHAHGISVG